MNSDDARKDRQFNEISRFLRTAVLFSVDGETILYNAWCSRRDNASFRGWTSTRQGRSIYQQQAQWTTVLGTRVVSYTFAGS